MVFHILDCFDDNIDNLDITRNYIYVLQLVDDRYYVGRTTNILKRIEQHFTGRGAIYTKRYKPLKVIEVILELTRHDETIKTFEIMAKYGWEKVRGACWCSLAIVKPKYLNNICWLNHNGNDKNTIINKIENKNISCNEKYTNKMDSPMLKMLKMQNPDVTYPSNVGQRWTDEEEMTLLDELDKNINLEIIAEQHSRTVGGINSRRREIAYKLYNNNHSIEEIMIKTKLNKNDILETIKKRSQHKKNVSPNVLQEKKLTLKDENDLKAEIKEMRCEIRELKNTIKELVSMMSAVYEFEDA